MKKIMYRVSVEFYQSGPLTFLYTSKRSIKNDSMSLEKGVCDVAYIVIRCLLWISHAQWGMKFLIVKTLIVLSFIIKFNKVNIFSINHSKEKLLHMIVYASGFDFKDILTIRPIFIFSLRNLIFVNFVA